MPAFPNLRRYQANHVPRTVKKSGGFPTLRRLQALAKVTDDLSGAA